METRFYTVSLQNFKLFLDALSASHTVVVPEGDDDYFFKPYDGTFTFTKYRAITSIRQFLTPCQESLGGLFSAEPDTRRRYAIVGVKNCDLISLRVQDFVFLEPDADQPYQSMRENNIIISSDCTGFKDVCFCVNLDIDPYPEELFDLNISEIEKGLLVEVGSKKGNKLINDNQKLFVEAEEKFLEERLANRKKVIEGLLTQVQSQELVSKGKLYECIKSGYEHPVWEDEALRCVECGACIMNCPTCHCFLIFDAEKDGRYLRGRIWDGCQYTNFGRVAGGANPLRLRRERLRNRYIKKFEFFPDVLGLYACTGCGRCIECCPAKIDLREIFKNLASGAPKSA